MAALDYQHNDGLQGEKNLPGFKPTLLAAPKSTATAIPAAAANTATVTGDITFAAPDGFIRMEMTEDTLDLIGDMLGDNPDSLAPQLTLNAFKPGLKEADLVLAQHAPFDDWLLLLRDCNGDTFLIGGDCGPVKCKTKVAGGKKSGGGKGHNYEFMAYTELRLYTGTITEKP